MDGLVEEPLSMPRKTALNYELCASAYFSVMQHVVLGIFRSAFIYI